jgi:hypothetical protein
VPTGADADEVRQTALEIAAYLRDRPGAADTLSGIITAWLPKVRLQAAAEIVLQALDQLERAGVVEKRSLPEAESSDELSSAQAEGHRARVERNYLYLCKPTKLT